MRSFINYRFCKMKRQLHFFIFIVLFFLNCNLNPSEMKFDVEGHRGCRGLMPENTVPAFMKAMDLRVNTLEMDLAISKDEKVIVSHEPYFRAAISLDPDGNEIPKEEETNFNMYQMTYEEIKQYDVGSKPDPRFPDRQNIKTYRPLFSEVVKETSKYCKKNDVEMPDFNIEIKRVAQYDHVYHPDAEKFVQLVLKEVINLGIEKHTIIQSFDLKSLREAKKLSPDIRFALLIDNDKSYLENIEALNFKPDIYSPNYKLIHPEMLTYCKQKNILVIPWTVNDPKDIEKLIALGVDGIISDYPDRVNSALGK